MGLNKKIEAFRKSRFLVAFLRKVHLSRCSREIFPEVLNLEKENALNVHGKSLREENIFSHDDSQECFCILATHKLVEGKFLQAKPREFVSQYN